MRQHERWLELAAISVVSFKADLVVLLPLDTNFVRTQGSALTRKYRKDDVVQSPLSAVLFDIKGPW